MVGWVAVWQAAKKDLSHSPYVTCFPNASAVRICYQPAPADGLGVLNCSLLTISFLLFLPATFFIPHTLSCLCHMSHGCDRWQEEADACWKHGRSNTHTQTKVPPTHMSVVPLCFHTVMFQSASTHYRSKDIVGILFWCLREALAVMYGTAHSLFLSHKHAASWGRADG